MKGAYEVIKDGVRDEDFDYYDEDDYEAEGDVYIDDSDMIQVIDIDEEDLPDAEDDLMDSSDESGEDIALLCDDSVQNFVGHTGEVYSVVCSPTNAGLVATGGQDDKGFLWSIGGDWYVEVQGDHRESVSCLVFSTDGQLLASGDVNGVIQIWDNLGNCKQKFDVGYGTSNANTDFEIEWVKWHPRRHVVLVGSKDCNVYMWNADKGALLHTFPGHGKSVTCGDFTPDGKIICTASADGTLRIWNAVTGQRIHVVKERQVHSKLAVDAEWNEGSFTCLAIKSDSTIALTGTIGGVVHVSNIKTGKVVNSLSAHSNTVNCIGFSLSESNRVAIGGADGKLVIWDVERPAPRCECSHEKGVQCLTWLGKSRFIAAGCKGGKIFLWDTLSGECVRAFSGHSKTVESLSVSCDQNFLVSVSRDKTARVFDISAYK